MSSFLVTLVILGGGRFFSNTFIIRNTNYTKKQIGRPKPLRFAPKTMMATLPSTWPGRAMMATLLSHLSSCPPENDPSWASERPTSLFASVGRWGWTVGLGFCIDTSRMSKGPKKKRQLIFLRGILEQDFAWGGFNNKFQTFSPNGGSKHGDLPWWKVNTSPSYMWLVALWRQGDLFRPWSGSAVANQ